jgi:hypothetical protein
LPTDLDIPNTETDIQLGALKVDDLINSIHSRTKIVLLDACRDNPALFKNLVSGRGSRAAGLAPTNATKLDQAATGGGIFIAYATGAGSVASDGAVEHSPFTLALLHNMTKPISIDDLFSLVTREVLLSTRNVQRPYKYASLEGIVCLATSCAAADREAPSDIIAEARRSEADAFEIALHANNLDAIETYLADYPNSPHRDDAIHVLSSLKLADFDEWTLFETTTSKQYPHYLQLNSIKTFGNRVVLSTRYIPDPSLPLPSPKPDSAPFPSYVEDQIVLDCQDGLQGIAHYTAFSESGDVLFKYKWADAEYLDLWSSDKNVIWPRSVGFVAKIIACDDRFRTPLVFKSQLRRMEFVSLSSTAEGDGQMFYLPVDGHTDDSTKAIEVVLITKLDEDRVLTAVFPTKVPASNGQLKYRIKVNDLFVDCAKNQARSRKAEYYDTSNRMVFLAPTDDLSPLWENIIKPGPLDVLRRIICKVKDKQE